MSDDTSSADVSSPLLAPLDSVQLQLLDAIWEPIVRQTAPWPVWAYVARDLYRRPDSIVDAATVHASLPTVPISALAHMRYGLVWMRGNNGAEPDPNGLVGLTVAGLMQLGKTREDAAVLLTAWCPSLR